MKVIYMILFLTITVGNLKSKASEAELNEIILESNDIVPDALREIEITKENNQKKIDLFYIQKAKFKMISGDLKIAEYLLNKIDDKTSSIVAIKKRYLGMIYFIQGKFQKSIDELNDKKINNNNYYTQTCLLRLINFMALGDIASINREKTNCQFSTMKFSKNDQYWLDTMLKLKTQNTEGVRRNLLTDVESTLKDEEMSKLWLKTGLYINKENELLELIGILPESSYQSKRLREIIAFMYLRAGDSKKALAFVDDIDTANAENIKGNINLASKEYELAFGHFKLALQKKQDSNNSLERAIPLAWILKQYNDGLEMLNNISNKSLDPRNTAAIRIAFLIMDKKFIEAQKELTLLKIAFKNKAPFEVELMNSYVDLALADQEKNYDKRRGEEAAEKACKSFDGINCWIALQYIQWDNLGKTVKRDELTYSDKAQTIELLKTKKSIEPLAENKTIDQSDIEELDGETISISPQ